MHRPTASTRARLGRMTTPHGIVETPQFMPVGTNATVKALDPDDLREVGATIILANTYHLALRPGHERIARLGGLHRVHGVGPVHPDRLRRLPGRQPGRVCARSTRTASPSARTSTARSSASHRSTRSRSRRHWARTSRSASTSRCRRTPRRARSWPTRPRGRIAGPSDAWKRTGDPTRRFSGSSRAGWRRTCARSPRASIAALPFDGLCIGGLAGDETPAQRRAALDVVVPLLESDPRPRYLMGLGSPMDLLDAVDAGVDLFDSVLPARVARNGTLWVPEGKLNLRNARFLDDPRPVQEGCRCRLCRTLLAGLSGPSLPGQRAARLPARNLSQPDLHPRLHGQNPVRHRGRQVPRTGPRSSRPAGCGSTSRRSEA